MMRNLRRGAVLVRFGVTPSAGAVACARLAVEDARVASRQLFPRYGLSIEASAGARISRQCALQRDRGAALLPVDIYGH
jgi:hypothetical protein